MRGCIGHLDDKAKLLDALLVLDRERQALQIHMAVLQAAVSKIRKQLHEERDQIKQLEVRPSLYSRIRLSSSRLYWPFSAGAEF